MIDRFAVANYGTRSLEIQDLAANQIVVVLNHPDWVAGDAGRELAELLCELLETADAAGELAGTVLAWPAQAGVEG